MDQQQQRKSTHNESHLRAVIRAVIRIMMRSLLGVVALVALVSGGGHKKQIALPVMGWSSWNQLGCLHLTEQQVLTQAIALNSSGLRQLGYTLIALDDWYLSPCSFPCSTTVLTLCLWCSWQAPSRNQSTGALEADHQRFPGGMKVLSTKLHSLGFKLGLYTCAGHYTCQLRPGALGVSLAETTMKEMGTQRET